MKNLTLTILVILALITACKKRKEDNPCDGKKPFKTDFKMFLKDKWSKSSTGDTLIEIKDGDTCIGGFVYFKAIRNDNEYNTYYDSVKWVFGNSLNTSKLEQAQLVFGIQEFNIPITLTGYKRKPWGIDCYPNVPTEQTITKKLSVTSSMNLPIIGSFFGANTDAPNDTFTITSRFEPRYSFLVIKNFPKGNRGFPFGIIASGVDSFIGISPQYYGYNYVLLDNQNGRIESEDYGLKTGIVNITEGNKIEINYEQCFTKDSRGLWINPIQRKFIGYRK